MQNYEVDLSFLKPYSKLIFLIFLNILMVAFLYRTLWPDHRQEQVIFAAKNQEYSAAETLHQQAEAQILSIDVRLPDFEALLENGLYGAQDRLEAAAIIVEIGHEYEILPIDYNFKIRRERQISEEGRSYRLFETEIELSFRVGNHAFIFDVLEGIRAEFQGYIGVTALELHPLNGETYRVDLKLLWFNIGPAALEEDAETRRNIITLPF